MAGDVHDRMVEAAMAMLAQRGLQATSFSELLAATGAPRGSLYHHFPGGKDQLVAKAVERAGAVLLNALEAAAGSPADAIVERFLAIWRHVLTQSDCGSGCAVLAVTVGTNAAEQLAQTTAVFRAWRQRLAQLLRQGGLTDTQSRQFAVFLIAAVEGAVVLSRADQSPEPFEEVARRLLQDVRAMVKRPAA